MLRRQSCCEPSVSRLVSLVSLARNGAFYGYGYYRKAMLEVESTSQRGCKSTRNGQNILESERAMVTVTIKCE